MIYSNPNIPIIPDPKGFDKAIAEIQTAVGTVPYIEKSFGRAFIHKENIVGKIVSLPKVYQGAGEYYNPLPNDNFKAQTFMLAAGEEIADDDFENYGQNTFTRKVALIFWGNLKAIDSAKDYIFLEEIKMDILEALRYTSSFKSFDSYVDERYSDVFREFSSYISNASKDTAEAEINTQYLMYPYSGFRMTITLVYQQSC